MKLILMSLVFPITVCAAEFPHNKDPRIRENINNRGGLPLKRSTPPSTWETTRKIERVQYYSIPPNTRPSWKEFKSYPPKVKLEN